MNETNIVAMRTISRIAPLPQMPHLKRVAAYARVSMSKETMLHSLAVQVSYYSDLIQKNAGWEYVGVYADSGLTGTKENRPEFQRMLADCRDGKIEILSSDLIQTHDCEYRLKALKIRHFTATQSVRRPLCGQFSLLETADRVGWVHKNKRYIV